MSDWQDLIVGDRMVVDDAFTARVEGSRFSRQEWSLIMTAASFEIDHAGDPERAELVADTSDVPTIIPELETVAAMDPMATPSDRDGGGGLLGSLRSALGLGDGGDDAEKLADAESLLAEYAAELQAHLESEGRWETVRDAATTADDEAADA